MLYTRDTGEIWSVDTSAASPVEHRIIGLNGGDETAIKFGKCSDARVGAIQGIADLPDGSLVAADAFANSIVHIENPTDPTNCTVESWAGTNADTTFSGDNYPNLGDVDGPSGTSRIGYPTAITIDGAGTVFFYDGQARKFKKIANDAKHTVSTIGKMPDGLAICYGMVHIGSKVYALGYGNNTTKIYASDGTALTKVAGGDPSAWEHLETPPQLGGIATDGTNLIVAGQGFVWLVSTTGMIKHIAGSGERYELVKDGNDPKAPHPALEVTLRPQDNPNYAAVGSPDYLGFKDGAIYYRGHGANAASYVEKDPVISAIDVSCIYELPLHLHSEGLDDLVADRLNIWSRSPDLSPWQRIVERFKKPARGGVTIGVVGKYVHLEDSYKSLHEALVHGGLANEVRVDLEYIDSEEIEREGAEKFVANVGAVLVLGGFGDRGTEGKIQAIGYARTNEIPFFGICLGMQLAVVEYARSVAGLDNANSAEFDRDTAHPVIDLMPEQRSVCSKGASTRLGGFPCSLLAGSIAAEAYDTTEISERYRHRYEFANDFREPLEKAGLVLSGTSPDRKLVEMVELREHPYFVGCQFHPEFKSRPTSPHPLFARFVRAAAERQQARGTQSRKSTPEAQPQVNGSKFARDNPHDENE